jgi:hypothetical protein
MMVMIIAMTASLNASSRVLVIQRIYVQPVIIQVLIVPQFVFLTTETLSSQRNTEIIPVYLSVTVST